MFDFALDLSTLLGAAFAVSFFSQWINNTWKLTGGWAQLRTWVVGESLAMICMKFHIGIFAEPVFDITALPLWAIDSILGLSAALLANYGYDKIKFVKAFLEVIKIRVVVGDSGSARKV